MQKQKMSTLTRSALCMPLLAALGVALIPSPLEALNLTAAQSRKTHSSGAGDRDVSIDIAKAFTDAVTVEPRALGSGHRLVFQFDSPITSTGNLIAIDDTLMPIAGATALPSGNTVIVTLPAVADNARVLATLSEVNGTGGYTASAALGFKLGDTDGNGAINTPDVSRAKARSGQGVAASPDALQAAVDFNGSGAITAADISAVKARANPIMLAAGNAANAAPVVTVNPVTSIPARQAAFVSGTATDDGLPFGALFTTWSMINGPAAVQFGDRTKLATTAIFPAQGSYTLRLTANDGQRASTADTMVTILPQAQLEIQPPIFQFAPVAVGQSSPAIQFFLINVVGTTASNLFFASTNPTEFAVTYLTCANNGAIAAMSYCTFAVTFSPSATGNRSASVIANTNPGGGATVLLQGVGQ